MNALEELDTIKQCPTRYVLAVNDTLNVISGKWKLPIIAALIHQKKRFKDLQQSIKKITPRMLSKELKELELNGIVKRIVCDSTPILIEYTLTESGQKLTDVIDPMIKWGIEHRSAVIRK